MEKEDYGWRGLSIKPRTVAGEAICNGLPAEWRRGTITGPVANLRIGEQLAVYSSCMASVATSTGKWTL
jgi:hypothetical protein